MALQDAFKFHGLRVEDFIVSGSKIMFVDPQDNVSTIVSHIEDLRSLEDFRVCESCLLAKRPLQDFERGYCEDEGCEAMEYFSP